mgnify:CR=1 FL=1
MYEKKIKFKGYDGVEREQSFFFNLTKAELLDMQFEIQGGFVDRVKKIIEIKDQTTIIKIFKEIILKSYGEKDDDGIHFNKVDPVTGRRLVDSFIETEAYSNLYVELATNEKAAADFINNVIPEDLAKEAKNELSKGNAQLPTA